ncbi:MAG: restriction endonuclease subunit S, partial [Candidatus Angelobacter sp.]
MPSDWRVLSIDEMKAERVGALSMGPFGSRLKSDLYVAKGIPVIRGNNISNTRAFKGEFVYVSPETAEELATSNVFPHDLVFPHRGAIGEVGIVPEYQEPRYLLSSSLMKLSCNCKIIDPVFLF